MTKVKDLDDFGLEVRRRRQARGWTLEQLAERSALTANYVGGIENGHRDPSLSTILSLAKGLEAPPCELFGPLPRLSLAAEEMGRLFDSLAADAQGVVLALLNLIVSKLWR